jgi:hypothetical protein
MRLSSIVDCRKSDLEPRFEYFVHTLKLQGQVFPTSKFQIPKFQIPIYIPHANQ